MSHGQEQATTAAAHRVVAQFLERAGLHKADSVNRTPPPGYNTTLESFRREATERHPSLVLATPPTKLADQPEPDLQTLVQDWFTSKIAKLSIEPTPVLDTELMNLEPPTIWPSKSYRAGNGTRLRKRFRSDEHVDCLMTASVDKSVKLYRQSNFELLETLEFSTPVLCTACHPKHARFFCAATMDGTVTIVDMVTRERVFTVRDHSKYVVRVAWSPNGRWLATLGYDKQIILYEVTEKRVAVQADDDDDELATAPRFAIEQRKVIHTKTNPEACIFLPDSAHFLWTSRDDNLLHELVLPTGDDVEGWQETKFNLNENQQDDWVSFSILYMTLHPHLPIVALQTSTDNSRILLYPFHSSRRILTIYTTASQSEYTTTARHCWAGDAAVVVNSDDGVIRIVDLKSKVLARIGAHGQAAPVDEEDGNDGLSLELRTERARQRRERDKGSSVIKEVVYYEQDGRRLIASCGFDKTVKVISVD
ncbi:hypothetical protein OIV83_004922 [Microbotryomycetes sp. JL201]|nr:hypothetical protein OIV83_004922 [Microbotryomycetes sp. JL201]